MREKDGTKCLTKTIDNKFFQRATVFLGAPDAKDYTVEADVMSDGNKRKMSEVGVINQRYAIVLKGNDQKLEVSSNFERLREAVDFKWRPECLVSPQVPRGHRRRRHAGWCVPRPGSAGRTRTRCLDRRGGTRPRTRKVRRACWLLAQDMRVYIDNISVKSNYL